MSGGEDLSYEKNIWFKSVTNVSAGELPNGSYYIYYHKDNIQYIDVGSGIPTATTPPNGFNYMATLGGSSVKSVNFYSHECISGKQNSRVAGLSFFGDIERWVDGTSSYPGAKIVGTFSGPVLKIFAKKGPDYGKIKIKTIKVSANGAGQQVVDEKNEIDLYSTSSLSSQEIYSVDIRTLGIFFTYKEVYGDYIFEIEILDAKNDASSGNKLTIEKYSFSKNYAIEIGNEEIKPGLAFKSIGGLK